MCNEEVDSNVNFFNTFKLHTLHISGDTDRNRLY